MLRHLIALTLCVNSYCESAPINPSQRVLKCLIGQIYKQNDCNYCECLAFGFLLCTRFYCDGPEYDQLENCEIGKSWREKCNDCFCTKRYGTMCTVRYCRRASGVVSGLRGKRCFLSNTITNDNGFIFSNNSQEVSLDINYSKTSVKPCSVKDISLCLYSRKNTQMGVPLRLDTLDDLNKASTYDANKDNYFIIHGFLGNHSSPVNARLKKAILRKKDCNVFVVDWSKIANAHQNWTLLSRYGAVFPQVPTIGRFVGNFIKRMIDHYHISSQSFKLIGHSLGAHVAGTAGAQLQKLCCSVDLIVGLDPAAPGFMPDLGFLDNHRVFNVSQLLYERLNRSNARFVQVIHTSALRFRQEHGRLGVSGLGIEEPIGHSDYYPNGGIEQPGCSLLDLFSTCSNSFAYKYYEESVLTGGFESTRCGTYSSYLHGECKENNKSYLGRLTIDERARDTYYLKTKTNHFKGSTDSAQRKTFG